MGAILVAPEPVSIFLAALIAATPWLRIENTSSSIELVVAIIF
jgi:hypothetical protein